MFTNPNQIRELDRLLNAILYEEQPLESALQDPACQKDEGLARLLGEEVETAQRLRSHSIRSAPLPVVLRNGRQRLEATIHSQRKDWRLKFWLLRLDWNVSRVLIVFLLFAASAQIIGQSQHAIAIAMPGDSLYYLKVATEQVQLDLAASPEDRVRLHLKFAHTRAIEFESLIIEQRFDLLPQTLAGMQSALGRARLMQNQIQGELPADIHESALSLEKTVHSQLVMMQFYAAPLPATLDAEMERVAWLASSQNYGSP